MKNIDLNQLASLIRSMIKEEAEDFGRIEISYNEEYGYDDELSEITCSARSITIRQNW